MSNIQGIKWNMRRFFFFSHKLQNSTSDLSRLLGSKPPSRPLFCPCQGVKVAASCCLDASSAFSLNRRFKFLCEERKELTRLPAFLPQSAFLLAVNCGEVRPGAGFFFSPLYFSFPARESQSESTTLGCNNPNKVINMCLLVWF